MYDSAVSGYRKQLKRWDAQELRYLTFSCHRRLQLLGRAEWRDELVRCLGIAHKRCGFSLIAWVVMPEHVHLIIVPRDDRWPVPSILRAIKQPVAQRAINRWKASEAAILEKIRTGDSSYRFWQAGGGFDRNVRDQDELEREVAYIHYNPVQRGLVENPVEWTWSSARWYAGERDGQIPIDRVNW